jgi:hypothetical protein
MTSDTLRSIASSGASVESLLASVHDRWLGQARRFIEPATLATAGFWDRWSATRYLGDQFLGHFRLEREFLASIAHLLESVPVSRLTELGEHIETVRAELDREGRQRGTGAAVAGDADELLREVSMWCAEIELAVVGLRREMLSPETNGLLDRLIASASLTAR